MDGIFKKDDGVPSPPSIKLTSPARREEREERGQEGRGEGDTLEKSTVAALFPGPATLLPSFPRPITNAQVPSTLMLIGQNSARLLLTSDACK